MKSARRHRSAAGAGAGGR